MSTLEKMHAIPGKIKNTGSTVYAGNNPRHAPVRLVKPISVPIYELPEYVCVETKWVSRKYAIENSIQLNGIHDKMTNGVATEAPKKPAQHKLNESTGMFVSEGTLPCRERAIQTEDPSSKDVGIQCRRDSEEWNLPEAQPKETIESPDSVSFLTYVSENTSMFPNGMLECQICGDIANTLLEHQAHMTVHYGPSALCFNCGQRLDHENLLVRHSLSCPALSPRKSSMLFKCPHPLCNAMCHSDVQLLQHLGKHSGLKSYRCLKCKRYFNTTTSFLIHRKKEQTCFRAKLLTFFRKHKGLPKGKSDPNRCTVCLKRFSSERICLKHRRKCILGHYRQMSKVLFKEL
ncbi:zinc finger protein 502 [Drosophila eugracilis]|uniref:zinc finger protein 502 n=1 Tax=Drosophila eugracilis TaxID=29029 RepID=UPI001BDAE022|nr:zinc finger protein 502 [Drosophila eugracilis]